MNRLFKAVVMNSIMMGCTIAGFFYEIDGAKNISIFLAWVLFLASMTYFSNDVIKKAKKLGRVFPVWIDVPFDFIIIGILVWHTAIFTAIAYALHMIFVHGNLANAENEISDGDLDSEETTG